MTTPNNESRLQTLTTTLSNPRLYVRRWFTDNHVSVLPNGDVFKGGQSALMRDVQNTAWLDYGEQLIAAAGELTNGRRIHRFKKDDFLAATVEYTAEVAAEFREKTIDETACTDEDLSELKKFIVAVAGEDSVELNVAIMAHFLWQIKRKMRGMPVGDHLMPIFFGSQGGGKTVAINRLLSPIELWVLPTSLPALQDERRAFALGQNYVAFCDEMQQAHKADVETLKNIISAPKVTPRVMRENTVSKVPQNCTFIGATNRSIAELIYDPTGMRRFVEIKTLTRLDREIINAIDYSKLFRGIDENRSTPYIDPFREQLEQLQAEYAADDPVVSFLEESGLLDGDKGNRTAFVSGLAVRWVYTKWCEENGYKALASGSFGKAVKIRGLGAYADRDGHARTRGYRATTEVAARIRKMYADKRFLDDLTSGGRADG